MSELMKNPELKDTTIKSLFLTAVLSTISYIFLTSGIGWLSTLVWIYITLLGIVSTTVAISLWKLTKEDALPQMVKVRVPKWVNGVGAVMFVSAIWAGSGLWVPTLISLVSIAILSINTQLLIEEADRVYTRRMTSISEMKQSMEKINKVVRDTLRGYKIDAKDIKIDLDSYPSRFHGGWDTERDDPKNDKKED